MASLLPLAPAAPLAAFVVLALAPVALARSVVALVGAGCALAAAGILARAIVACGGGCEGVVATVLTLPAGSFDITLALSLDPLNMIGAATVAVVGSLVLVYATAYMAAEPLAEQRRFFAQMNLFLSGMLTVVLAADLALFFLGWEIIGLCSFFLIAFDTRSGKSAAAATKALVTTRIADTMLLAGFLLLFLRTGSTQFSAIAPAIARIDPRWTAAIAGLVAAGALGKSAQLPFQIWLPSAMTGPTPVSALLHSATMVAAGVIVLARLAPLYAAVPHVATALCVVAAATAALAALAAVLQSDIKKLLAYSTISQIGLMVLALGAGAPAAAIAHFVIHGAFKSLLFLSAGVLSHAVGGATSLETLRGSYRREPLATTAFALGAASLAGIPIVTAGWFSKEAVLAATFAIGPWGAVLWALAVATAVLTGVYAFRAIFLLTSPGDAPHHASWSDPAVVVPLVILAALALGGGWSVESLVAFAGGAPRHLPLFATLSGAAAPLLGAAIAWRITRDPGLVPAWRARLRHVGARRVDALYYAVFTRGFRRLAGGLAGADAGSAKPAGDPLGRVPVAAALRLTRTFVSALNPDRIDLAWTRAAASLTVVWGKSRRLQAGLMRSQALSLALGVTGLLLFAWGTTWR